MAFVKGQSGNPLGKPVGTISKDKAKFLAALEELFDKYSGDMMEWLAQVEDVEKRFEILSKYAEFLYPKLARNTLVGDPEQPQVVDVTVKGKILSMLTEEQLRQIEANANT